MRILVLPYNVDNYCLCIWTVHVIQSCIMITAMYNELRHELYYTGNTFIIELNRIQIAHVRQNTLEIYVAKYP